MSEPERPVRGRVRGLPSVALLLLCVLLAAVLTAEWQVWGGENLTNWRLTTLGWVVAGMVALVLGVVALTRSRRPLLAGVVLALVVVPAGGLLLLFTLTDDRLVSSATYGRSPDGRLSLVITQYSGAQDFATVYVVRDYWHLVRHERAVEWPQDGYVPSRAHWVDDRTVSVDGGRIDINASRPYIPPGP
jgi:hypothetical protein